MFPRLSDASALIYLSPGSPITCGTSGSGVFRAGSLIVFETDLPDSNITRNNTKKIKITHFSRFLITILNEGRPNKISPAFYQGMLYN